MKKRLLSALLALALVFVLLPTTALAGETTGSDYDISINGKGWKFDTDDSGANIPVYYYANYTFNTDAGYGFRTNDNLMLTKVGNTVTISFRRGTGNKFYSNPVKFTIESKVEGSDISCIEMGNGNNLVITGEGTKGTLTLTRDGKDGIGAALSSKVGDITITGGATVNVTFKKQSTPNVSGHAISVDNHDLIISGEGTTVEATNQSGASQDFSNDATVKVENGRIDVSGGAWLKATNEFSNTSKPYPSDFNNYSYFSCAISGDKDAPCTVSVTGENSCIIASAHNSTKYVNTSMGQAYRWANFKVDGAKIEVGTSSPAQTITDINNIKNYKYAKISVPALEKDSYVYIAGGPAVVGQWTNIPAAATGTGSYYYDADKKELTIKDVNITHSDGAIVQFMAGAPYIIKLEGTNSIKDVNSFIRVPERGYESLDGLSVTISGAGSLEVIARGNAITMLKGNLIFNNTGAIALETTTINGKAINVSGDISIGSDFNKNLKITADNGAATFDPTIPYTDYNDLKNYKSISFSLKDSTISYGNKTLKQGETIYGETSGTATVDRKNNTITLNNFKGDKALVFNAEFTPNSITLIGDSTLSAVETKYQDLTISVSGSGSLTVGSIRVPNNTQHTANLTITGGAHVTVNRPSEDKPAVEVSGNLTVTGDGTQLSAECTAATNPAIEVGGNVTISGNPGTNAYTVKAYNKYATQRGRDDKLRPSQMPSAFEISGNLSISGSAQVMAQTDSDGAAVWMPKEKVISVADASLIAQNRSHNFSTISFGDESNMGNIYAKGQVNIVAENMLHSNSSLAHKAIKAFIYNHYNTGDSNPYYIKVVSEGVQSGGNVNVIPGDCTSTGGYKVTITRGDAYTTPQVAANYTIAGQTMYVGKYYKTDVDGNITDGTAQDYNIYCDSENDFTLNNATISSTGTDVAINTNIRYETNVQHHIKLIGTNRINNTFKHAISAGSNSSTIIIEGVGNASDASLTINGNFLPIYSDGKVIINAEVVIVNTTDDNSFKGLISTSDGKGAFDLGSGYKCYASTSTTGTPLEEFNSANYSTYKYLRVTTQTLETGGGSTHQHTWDTTKWYSVGDDYHARKCTGCDEYDLTNKQAHYAWPDEDKGPEGHTEKCMLCDYKYDQSVIKPHEWTGWWVSDYQPEVHAQRCNCGYQGSTHRTLKYVAINSEQHQKQCPVDGCGYKIEYKTSHVYEEGSNICTECGYDKSAPCNHTGDRVYTNNGDGTHKVTCKACGATIVEKETHEFDPTGACVCGATQSGGNPTPDNPGTIVIIRPAEEEKPAQQPNPSTGANDLVGMAVAAAVVAVLGSVALLRKHD